MNAPTHHIFLVGMPASGKSELGKKLAEKLSIGFIDTDESIVASEGMSVADIFKQKGEAYFRDSEATWIRTIADQTSRHIVATGGGLPCFHQNMNYMNEQGITIFLDVNIDLLVKRIIKTGGRPIFEGDSVRNIRAKLEQLLTERTAVYNKAQFRLSVETPQEEANLLNRIRGLHEALSW